MESGLKGVCTFEPTITCYLMKQIVPFLLAGALLAACNNRPSPAESVATTPSTTKTLTEADLFNQQIVGGFLQAHPGDDEKANALFMHAVDAYRNKKDITGAIALFRQSILQHPMAKAYYEMGNASMDAKDYQHALKAFRMGEQLGFEPLSKLLYNTACVWSLLGQKDTAVTYLEYAIEAGYANTDQIMKDADLAIARTSELFKETFQSAMSGQGDEASLAFQTFKRGFGTATFPLVLNKETEAGFASEQYISYEFEKFIPEMKGERFSREVGKEFYYLTKVSDRPEFTTVVYAVKNVMMGEGAPTAYMLASFTGKGRLIDKMVAGGQLNPGDMYRVATIQQSGQFEVKEYKQEYAKDPAENGYHENKLLSTDLKKTLHFRISDDGHFESDERMVGMR